MKVVIGSTNKVKVNAVQELLVGYPLFEGADILDKETASGVSDQPLSLEETTQGAINRAKEAFNDCDYSIGIESGLIPMNYEGRASFMNICICAIYDGKQVYTGASSMFQIPESIAAEIRKGKNLSDAAHLSAFTKQKDIGKGQGVISLLTKGRIDRKEYTKQALRMALIYVENQF